MAFLHALSISNIINIICRHGGAFMARYRRSLSPFLAAKSAGEIVARIILYVYSVQFVRVSITRCGADGSKIDIAIVCNYRRQNRQQRGLLARPQRARRKNGKKILSRLRSREKRNLCLSLLVIFLHRCGWLFVKHRPRSPQTLCSGALD